MDRKVLDRGWVRLIDFLGSDTRIVQAARVSYGEGTKTLREDAALIDYLMRHGHTSPFEMVDFTFHIKAPIFVARQMLRHRTASVNEISARYSIMSEEFYQPAAEELRAQSTRNKQVGEGTLPENEAHQAADRIKALHEEAYQTYQELLGLGLARELAREVLPVGLYTEFYWKIDLHNLLHFLELRLDWHAQKEIQAYAEAISEFVAEKVPLAWSSFLEHRLGGIRLSKTEREALLACLDLEAYRRILEARGVSKSRLRECLEKWNAPSGD